jgi:hypothetical protein
MGHIFHPHADQLIVTEWVRYQLSVHAALYDHIEMEVCMKKWP